MELSKLLEDRTQEEKTGGVKADLSEDLFVDSEGQVQHVLDVVVLHPLQALMELLIQELQVAQVTRAAGHRGQHGVEALPHR